MFHHGTIRKYTAALLDIFNDLEIQHKTSSGELLSKKIPIRYSTREKATIFDEYSTEQLLSGNYSILPRASLAMASMAKSEQRVTNKNTKINQFKTDSTIEFSYNSVPYEFSYEIIIQCRGMNEVTQIIEQIAPKFNPTLNVDIWDAQNLSEPTRVPIKLTDIQFSSEEYEELSSNIFTITISIALIGNLYPPIKSQERVQTFMMMINGLDGDYYTQKEMLEWDVNLDGYLFNETLDNSIDGTEYPGTSVPPKPSGTALTASRISVLDIGDFFTGTNLEEILQELGLESAKHELKSNKGVPHGYAPLDDYGRIPANFLPSYVDDVLEYDTVSLFPEIGETGKIYVDLEFNETYRWGGSSYIYITSGAVDSVAGKTGVVTLAKADVGLGNVDNTSDLNKPISTATQTALDGKSGTSHTHSDATTTASGLMSSTDKSKLDGIASGATAYVHPSADGSLHVPATGTTNAGKVLTAGATAGSLSWTTLPADAVSSVAGKTGAVTLAKGDVGLGNVDNTSDLSKPISTATQTALDSKISTSGVAGDILYHNGTTFVKLAKGTNGQILSLVNGLPAWVNPVIG